MKRCSKCEETKPLSDFYKGKYECKTCWGERTRAWRAANAEAYGESNRRYRESHREKFRHHSAAYIRRHRDEVTERMRQIKEDKSAAAFAWRLVELAVRKGRLVRPSGCTRCGEVGPVHGHHEDYERPLDVDWLCSPCHKARHKELGETA